MSGSKHILLLTALLLIRCLCPAQERMPSVYIETEDVIQDKIHYVRGTVRFVDQDHRYSDTTLIENPMGIRFRGKLSLRAPKKSFRIRMDRSAAVFGMPDDRDWLLIANYFDKSLLRNKLGMQVSKVAAMAWTPSCRTCEVYMNGDYLGCYDLFQRKSVGSHKVDIQPIKPDEDPASGDYYLEIESVDPDFHTPVFHIPVIFNTPSAKKLTAAQRNYVYARFQEMERLLKEDPASGRYRQFLDIRSCARFYIIQELSKNIDGVVRKSTYLTLRAGEPFTFYHVWDFDLAFGNVNYMPIKYMPASIDRHGEDPEGFFIKDVSASGSRKGLMHYLFCDPAFVAEVKATWEDMYPELCLLKDWLTEEAALCEGPYRRDFQRWASSRFRERFEPWPHARTYDAARDRLISFYEDRLSWLDAAIRAL